MVKLKVIRRDSVCIYDHQVHSQFIQNPSLLKGMNQSLLFFSVIPELFSVFFEGIESRILSGILNFGKILRISFTLSISQHNHKHVVGSNLPPTQIPPPTMTQLWFFINIRLVCWLSDVLPKPYSKYMTILELLLWNLKGLDSWKQVSYIILPVHEQGFLSRFNF